MQLCSLKLPRGFGLLSLALALGLGCEPKTVTKENEDDSSSETDEEKDTKGKKKKSKPKKDSTEDKKDKESGGSSEEDEDASTSDDKSSPESGDEDEDSEKPSDEDSKTSGEGSTSDEEPKDSSKPDEGSDTGTGGETPKKVKCEGDEPRVYFKTNHGSMIVKLEGARAPTTVKNFIDYVNDGYYNDTIFHRVISGFMIQGGGYDTQKNRKKDKAPIKLETSDVLKHLRGAISMARGSSKNSATAQFFICHADTPQLDNQYAVFGYLTKGEETLDSIAKVKTGTFMEGSIPQENWPIKNVVIEKAFCIK